MFQTSAVPPDFQPFQIYLEQSGQNERIYKALQHEDIAEVVVIAMDILSQTTVFELAKEHKSESKSDMFRNEGNMAYRTKRYYRKALECYNKAILHAPENSKAMRLAYSNRSALLFTIEEYTACLKDIETVFSMGCTDNDLVQKLRQRKTTCLKLAKKKEMQTQSYHGTMPKKYFNFDVKRHPQINCASAADVKVEIEDGLPKVVAARNIPVGTLIAIETPFVSELEEDIKTYIACFYCHRLTLNLIPCDGCCVAMFCDNICKTKCNQEFHDIECKIMNCMQRTYTRPGSSMKVKAALKMRHLCKSWKELIEASYTIGENRMRVSSIGDIFDGRQKFSLLSFEDPAKHFIYGERFGAAFTCATILHNLSLISNFFPKEAEENDAAIRALARIMMLLFLSYPKVEIVNGGRDVCIDQVATYSEVTFGWFAFVGKLKHCCDANLITLGLKNKAALVAIHPIKKGEELTTSYLGHYFQTIMDNRAIKLFYSSQKICNCTVCTENWNPTNLRRIGLNFEQKKAYEYWISVIRSNILVKREEVIFKVTTNGLATLHDVRGSKPYHDMFREFRGLMGVCQYIATNNQFIQKDDQEFEVIFT